jgi:uncharacterized protein (DUF433 family)
VAGVKKACDQEDYAKTQPANAAMNPTPLQPLTNAAAVPSLADNAPRRGSSPARYAGNDGSLISESRTARLVSMSYQEIITIEPDKRGGKPCIRGLRITVYDVLEYLASGMSEEQILKDFPELTKNDIKACLEFAADRERKLVSIPPV